MKRLHIAYCILYIFVLSFAVSPILAQQSVDDLPVKSGPVSIADAVDLALKNNPMVFSSAAMARAAEARVGMAKSMTKPRVSATTFGATGTMPSILQGPPAVDPAAIMQTPNERQLDQNLMAMFPLYTGGRLSGQVDNARNQAKTARAEEVGSKLDVALEVRTAYRRTLVAAKFVEAYQLRVNESKERLRIAEVAFQEGRIAKYDLLRNQTELAEAEQMLVDSRKDNEIALIDLKTALGLSLASDLTLTDQLTMEARTETLPDLLTRAKQRRPEISAARSRVAAAEASSVVAKSGYRPQVYAVAMQDFVWASSMRDQGYTVGVTVGFPLLDGGARKSATREAKAMIDQAKAEEQSALLAANREVGTAWAEAEASAKNAELAKVAVDQAEEDYRVIKLRYEAGKAINVEVLDALASLTRAQTNHAQALYNYGVALDRLHRAVGDLI